MGAIVTLRERRERALTLRREAQRRLENHLATAASRHGGRYRVFGSAARGDMRPESDVDLLADFPERTIEAAIRAAEDACVRLGLAHDVLDQSGCSEDFLRQVLPESRVIG